MTNTNPSEYSKTPELSAESFSFESWMANFLRIVMRVSLGVGLVMVIVSPFSTHSTTLFVMYVLMYVVVLAANFAPLPYRIRAGIFVSIFYILGISGLLENGTRGDAQLFFAIFMIMSALFFGYKATKFTIGLTLLAGIIFGGLILSGVLHIVNGNIDIGNYATWGVAFTVIILSSLVITYGLRLLFQEFTKAQNSAAGTVALLSEERSLLETRVTERTEELLITSQRSQRQAEQLKAISEVARQIALVRRIEDLLPAIARLISEKLGFYHTGIFLLDDNKEYIILRAANSEGGKAMMERGHKFKVGGPGLVNYAVTMNRPRIALDVGDDAFFFNNPDLPNTRSEMALPLKIGNQAIGALDVQSTESSAFSTEDLEVMETLADQVALAFENARLLDESRQRLAKFQEISRELVSGQWNMESPDKSMRSFQYSPKGINALQKPVHRLEVQNALATGKITEGQKGTASVAVPVKVREQVVGVFNIRASEPDKKFSEEEISFLRAIAERVAFSMENARLFREAQKRAAKERAISNIASQIGESANIDKILKTAAEEIGRTLPGSEVIVQIRPQ